MALPDETHCTHWRRPSPYLIEMPEWKFWYSPLVSEGITNAKDNLQPQVKAIIDGFEVTLQQDSGFQ